ncbi:exodeoxyribonuclease V subunit beta [Buchnera aphidicola]|uniref:exodeoxyribonuclease V subunit beta n=1 Tax=Buchnera aphidicola TaxID=9 RepID=UPI0034646F16
MIKNNKKKDKKEKNQNINIFSTHLNGKKIIEASAGTGKTFTIILLYLRLLLGININTQKKYSVENILIITYTKNAVKEIKKRLEKNIYNLYLDFLSKKTKNKNYKKIFKKVKNFNHAAQILKKSYINIHNASIYTIHGFCRYILKKKNYYFEYLIKKKKVYNENLLYQNSTYIFWRNFFYPYNKEISQIIFEYWKNPQELFKEIQPWLNIKSDFFLYTKKNNDIMKYHEKNIKKIKKFKKKWKEIYINLKKIFHKKILNQRIYHKKNFNTWVKKIKKWTLKKTKNYKIPKELFHFSKKKIEKNVLSKKKKISFLNKIDKFLKKNFSLKEALLIQAIKKIPKICKKIKKKKFSYENLISSLLTLLKKKKSLSQYIQKKFPIAFIDEFQDTDMQQYKIFQKIYNNKKIESSLILVGDPKQSIYNFRGADIFFYLKIKSKIPNIYTLNTNWRSSKKLIESINFLFSRMKKIFLFKKIKFIPALSPKESKKKKYFIKKKEQPAIKFWLKKNTPQTPFEYNNWIAKKCSQNIYFLIQKMKKSQAFLITKEKRKKLKIQDICILVKNYQEYKIMKKELLKLNIYSYYTSYNKSIFHTIEVKELYYILQSILDSSNENYFNRALATSIIFQNTYVINKIKKKYSLWSNLKKTFSKYKKIWKKKGILNLINEIISTSNLYKNYFFHKKYKEKISNLIHLGKILEKKSCLRKERSSIISWLKKKINQINDKKKYQQKLHHNKYVINITTIYKSKGLQYPIIWIPFISNFTHSKKFIFHDKKKYNTFINLCKSKKKIKLEEKEKLSEEIRLLYVAITRAIFQCNLGVSSIIIKKNKYKTNFHKSGLGYVLQKGKKMTIKELYHEIKKIEKNKNITCIFKKKTLINKVKEKKKKNKNNIFKILNFKRHFKKNFNTSYTRISQIKKNFKKKDIFLKFEKYISKKKKITQEISKNNFPKGKKYGKILHKILEKINFNIKIHKKFIKKKIKKVKLSKKWIPIIKNWIKSILVHPFGVDKINLKNIQKKCIKEVEFYLQLKKEINFFSINKILKNENMNFLDKNKGILKGFIDLIFQYDEKYYFVDYKSNFLGETKNYQKKNLEKYFLKEKYNIQFYLYSLALHKFLQKKVKNYNFKKNFGGGYYLFLRGMDGKNSNQGTFFLVPKHKILKKINKTFFKKEKI